MAYYRHSAQDRQENSVAIQQEQVQQWAQANGVEIIHEFSDRGKSGLTAEGRDGFNDMMENWVKLRDDFQFVLCLDVSRWGRFQDIDLSATYSADCKRHGKQVIYTTLGKPKPNDQLYQVYVQFERFRAAQYSKELSDKVFRGCVKISQQGYWAGGKPPYGFRRMLLDEARHPVQILAPGQRKSIQNQRVTLAEGDTGQVLAIRRIFQEFTETLRTTWEIAHGLNRDGIASPSGSAWDGARVRHILINERYVGTMIYNKTTQKLKTPTRHNPKSDWVKTERAFGAIIDREVFDRAQAVLAQTKLRYTPEFMLVQLERLLGEHDMLRPSLLRSDAVTPSATTYAKRFLSLDCAYQQVFRVALTDIRTQVESLLRGTVSEVESYDDFLVLNRRFTVLIQPSVPIPYGYNRYWYFRPDRRGVVDITLGVPVSGPKGPQILGYLALPRLLVRNRGIRLFGSSGARLDMYGHQGLEIISQLARSK
ncbi:MAG: recombinase family protein [Planctomycetes bacterium]|nr:recombinase family protein [Planctomycetota bacterium]